ncbi:MAG TPA: hypothetical protein VGA00_06820 [Acidiferrobacterales bacterium]|jgi:hypothetical protein
MSGSNFTRIAGAALATSLLALGAGTPVQAGDGNTVRAGFLVNPVGTVAMVEYEHLLGSKASIGARLGYIDYDYKDGSYREVGDGPGIEFLGRFYPQGKGHEGFYVGGAIGLWRPSWRWTDPFDTPTSDTGTSSTIDVNFNIGWKIPLGTKRVYLDPHFAIGNFFSLSSDDTANLGFYAAAGLSVGMVF